MDDISYKLCCPDMQFDPTGDSIPSAWAHFGLRRDKAPSEPVTRRLKRRESASAAPALRRWIGGGTHFFSGRIREDACCITSDRARFIPHFIE
jgi:hypothetical protein